MFIFVCIYKSRPMDWDTLRVDGKIVNIDAYTHLYTSIYICLYSQSHLRWHFRMLFQSSKVKARTSLFNEMWQKRVSSFELWAFDNVTPSGIGCICMYICLFVCIHIYMYTHTFTHTYYRYTTNTPGPKNWIGIACMLMGNLYIFKYTHMYIHLY